jgi:hypothetical protein
LKFNELKAFTRVAPWFEIHSLLYQNPEKEFDGARNTVDG